MSQRHLIDDRFEIADLERDLLGRGGMGDVYRGTDLQTRQAVAIKALRPEVVSSDPNALARFLREGKALRQLNHPNIVQVVDGIEENDRHYLVMEYVPGGSLRDLLDQQRSRPDRSKPDLSGLASGLPIQRTVEIALEVADALTRAHHLGILHRDLKPSNVLLAEDGTPRLSDFGHAHLATGPRLTQTGTVVGTVLYLSPEALRGETLDARADIWAFGVMLYEMLAGQVPFPGETFPEVFMAILGQPVPDVQRAAALQARPEVPDALADLVYRMLEKEPAQRIPSVRLVGAELEAISAGHRLQVEGWQVGGPRQPQVTESRFAAPTPPTEKPKHNLPVQPTPFVGREAELDELDRLLSDPDVRLVTILGAGGMGKTRLALQAAERQVDRFSSGVFFVSLASLQSIEAIVPAIASALGFQFYGGGSPCQQLLDYLREKQMLLLLDNYEHLLDGSGGAIDIVADILGTAPRTRILVTSRARLSAQGEQLFHLAGMDFPDWETPEDAADPAGRTEYSAVKLFLQSARRVRPGFKLEADDLKHISRICRLVGGMPLGVLLAAAWVEVLAPREIADEIEGQMPGLGLDFLETDLHDVPERQRSMRAVFDHSWNLLAEREQQVFQALSVFRGGFTRHAVQQVTGVTLRDLMALVNRSLLHRTPGGRYEVHELLRQYAAEKLDRSPDAGEAVRDKHCAHYATALEGWDEALKGPRQLTALVEVEAEVGNVRAAWDWAAERGYVERLAQAMDGLCRFYEWRGRYEEGEAACRGAADALALAGQVEGTSASGEGARPALSVAEGVRARATAWRGLFNRALHRLELAKQLLEGSLAHLEALASAGRDVRREQAFALWQMGYTLFDFGANEDARQQYEASLALYRALDDRWAMATVLYHVGDLIYLSGAFDEANALVRESLAIQQDLDDHRGMAGSLRVLGLIAVFSGRFEESERLVRESVAAFRTAGDRAHAAEALHNLSVALIYLGRLSEARARAEESVAIYSDLGFGGSTSSFSLIMLGWVEMLLGRYDQARASAQTALTQARERAWAVGIQCSLWLLGRLAIAECKHAQGQQLLQQSCSQLGGSLAHYQATVFWGYAARGLGQLDQARRHLYEGLRWASEGGESTLLIEALPAIALLLADREEAERAVELYALASRYPVVANAQWYEDVAGKQIAAAAVGLPPEVVAAAQERGRARDLRATVEELLEDLSAQRP